MIIPTELTIFIPQAPTFEILGFFSNSMSEITSTLTLSAQILRFPQIQNQSTRSTQLRNQEKVTTKPNHKRKGKSRFREKEEKSKETDDSRELWKKSIFRTLWRTIAIQKNRDYSRSQEEK
ncbi:hypothetical protein MRB53_029596 [Persea americana]|uniref:Uncharacterized protein n=1 Tax=Persea americana TaxID=3435 RepID=A0ACC2KJ63_PERAE|nr:hypothetical protein MRB53_029596 [Persea americana]